MSEKTECGYIYVMTNPIMKGLVKIGYATNPEKRRKDLSHASGVPVDFEIYATYEVPVKLADKKVHSLIIALNPSLKLNPKKEFFVMEPEAAYKILEVMASIHGRLHKLYKYVCGKPVVVADEEHDDPEEEIVLIEDAATEDGKVFLEPFPDVTNQKPTKFSFMGKIYEGGVSYRKMLVVVADYLFEKYPAKLKEMAKDGKYKRIRADDGKFTTPLKYADDFVIESNLSGRNALKMIKNLMLYCGVDLKEFYLCF